MSDITEVSERPLKKSVSPEKLEQLRKAREKALDKKRLLGEIAKKEKEMKEQALSERISKVKEFEAAKKPSGNILPQDPCYKKEGGRERSSLRKKKLVEVYESSESSSDESVEIIRRKKEKKPVAQMATAELTAQIAREEIMRRVEAENKRIAFKSLFPNYKHMLQCL